MKRFVVLLLALTMIFGLVACGGGSKTTTCDLCGKEDVKCKSITYEGETGWFCDDCYDLANSAIKMMEAAS